MIGLKGEIGALVMGGVSLVLGMATHPTYGWILFGIVLIVFVVMTTMRKPPPPKGSDDNPAAINFGR